MNLIALKTLQKQIKKDKLSALLITNMNNISYLSGFHGTAGFMLVTSSKAFLLTDSRYVLKAKLVLPKSIKLIDITRVMRNPDGFKGAWKKLLSKIGVKKIGFEGSDITFDRLAWFKKISRGISFINTNSMVEKFRQIKTAEELRYLTKSQRINEATLSKVIKFLKAGVSEREIGMKIQIIGRELGADDMSFDPIVAFGPSSASPHHEPGSRKLKKGYVALIDMGMKYKGYCSDMTRTYLPKKASDQQQEVYSTVLAAQMNCIKNVKAGMTGQIGDAFSRDLIKDAGYGNNFGHSTGHGIGLDIHEAPNQAPRAKEILPEGTVVTAEPGIYLPGNFGVRIEDMIIIRKGRSKEMTKMEKRLEKIMIL